MPFAGNKNSTGTRWKPWQLLLVPAVAVSLGMLHATKDRGVVNQEAIPARNVGAEYKAEAAAPKSIVGLQEVRQTSSSHSESGSGAGPLDGTAIISHLNAVISWYRDCSTKVESVGLPSDAAYQENTRNSAAEAVRLAFQSARAEAALINAEKGNSSNASQPSLPQDASQMQATMTARLAQNQSLLDALDQQLASARSARRKQLLAQRDKLHGEIDLDRAVLDAIKKLASFELVESSSDTLVVHIDQLAHSVPEVFSSTGAAKQADATSTGRLLAARPSGLYGAAESLYSHVRAIHEIDQLSNETTSLRALLDQLRKPLHENISATVQRGRDLANQTARSGSIQNVATPSRQDFDALVNHFNQLAAAALPLEQEAAVLEDSSSNLFEWRGSILRDSRSALHSLILHVIAIGVALALVLILSEVWRRFTFRYVHDLARRRGILIVRRLVIAFLVAVVLLLGFVSELGSLATFAGFVTAGIAVALQAILLSVAAYFFLIGRYGIQVGDRVSVSGVTGEVVEVGIVRFSLMELAGTGVDLFPTGRLVVFSNSVLFQTAPLYKQIPGTDYTWHEVAVTLSPAANCKLVEAKILGAVNSVYHAYREEMERQHDYLEQQMEIHIAAPVPEPRLFLSEAGLEFAVRYPVNIQKAPDIDEQITRGVLETINREQDLKVAISGTPRIRSAGGG